MSSASARSVTDKVRADGDNDVDRELGLGGGFEQQLHEGDGVILLANGVGGLLEAKGLFELVNDDEQVVALLETDQLDRLNQVEAE
ncbi:MAG: hypothetical protein P4L26_12725 [Terracidiphilus sp.]|nr:hypothetical protein [Terracidiphilus sp.]